MIDLNEKHYINLVSNCTGNEPIISIILSVSQLFMSKMLCMFHFAKLKELILWVNNLSLRYFPY